MRFRIRAKIGGMQIWSRLARIFGIPGVIFAGLAVWAVLEVLHTATYAAELIEKIPEAVDKHAGWTVAISVLFLALVIGWPDVKRKFPGLRLFPRSLDEWFHELNHIVMVPETGHCDRIKAAEKRLALTALLTDVAERDKEVAMTALSADKVVSDSLSTRISALQKELVESAQKVSNSIVARFASVETDVGSTKSSLTMRLDEQKDWIRSVEHLAVTSHDDISTLKEKAENALRAFHDRLRTIEDRPPLLRGIVWFSAAPGPDEWNSTLTYRCDCINLGTKSCEIGQVVFRLSHVKFQFDTPDMIPTQDVLKLGFGGQFNREAKMLVQSVTQADLVDAVASVYLQDNLGTKHEISDLRRTMLPRESIEWSPAPQSPGSSRPEN
jgi:hypothetical protein